MIESPQELKEAQDLCLEVSEETGVAYEVVNQMAVKLYNDNRSANRDLPYWINKVRENLLKVKDGE